MKLYATGEWIVPDAGNQYCIMKIELADERMTLTFSNFPTPGQLPGDFVQNEFAPKFAARHITSTAPTMGGN